MEMSALNATTQLPLWVLSSIMSANSGMDTRWSSVRPIKTEGRERRREGGGKEEGGRRREGEEGERQGAGGRREGGKAYHSQNQQLHNSDSPQRGLCFQPPIIRNAQ